MKKQFKFLLFLFSVVAVNNIVSLDSNSDRDREQRLYVVTELFRTQIVAGLADKAMTLSAANWKRVLDDVISSSLTDGVNPADILRFKKLNSVMLAEGLKFRNNCRVLWADKKTAESRIAKAELVGEVAESVRLAAHREIIACNPLEHARYAEAVGCAARVHSISVIAHKALADAHKELDHALLYKQSEILAFSRTMAVTALDVYPEILGDKR